MVNNVIMRKKMYWDINTYITYLCMNYGVRNEIVYKYIS